MSGTLELKKMKSLDAETIRKALTVARDSGFRSIKLKNGDHSFHAVLAEEAMSWGEHLSEGDINSDDSNKPKQFTINAPVVGIVKILSDFNSTGTQVSAGQIIGEVVALGISNEVVSPGTGKIVTVCVNDGAPVEYGQAIFEVEE